MNVSSWVLFQLSLNSLEVFVSNFAGQIEPKKIFEISSELGSAKFWDEDSGILKSLSLVTKNSNFGLISGSSFDIKKIDLNPKKNSEILDSEKSVLNKQKKLIPRLNLCDRSDMDLEQIWQFLYPKYIESSNNLVLNIKDKASFTDTRLLSIWCRSEVFFSNQKGIPKTFITQKNGEVQESGEITYLAQPSIGGS